MAESVKNAAHCLVNVPARISLYAILVFLLLRLLFGTVVRFAENLSFSFLNKEKPKFPHAPSFYSWRLSNTMQLRTKDTVLNQFKGNTRKICFFLNQLVMFISILILIGVLLNLECARCSFSHFVAWKFCININWLDETEFLDKFCTSYSVRPVAHLRTYLQPELAMLWNHNPVSASIDWKKCQRNWKLLLICSPYLIFAVSSDLECTVLYQYIVFTIAFSCVAVWIADDLWIQKMNLPQFITM